MATAKELLTNLADSIRTKSGVTGSLSLAQMKTAVDGIRIGEDLPTLSNPATAEDILVDKEAYDDAGNKITGIITSRGYALYSLSNKDHIIDVDKGYYKDGVTFRLSPTENEKIIPENIKEGVSILGVTGSLKELPDSVTYNTAEPMHVLNGFEYVDFDGNYQVGTMPSLAGVLNIGDAESVGRDGATFDLPYTGYIGSNQVKLDIDHIVYDLLNGTDFLKYNIQQGINPILRYGSVMLGGEVRGTYTSDATATAADILSGKTAYVKGEILTGTIATKTSSNLTVNGATVNIPAGYYASAVSKSVAIATQATPSISINESTGVITASATQSAGYVSAGTKSATMQLQTRGARVITPGKDSITILAGNYLTGNQIIIGSDDLIPENIRKGITIFGVTGTYEPATGPYSILESTTSFVKLNDWTIRLTLNSQGITDGAFKSGMEYQLVIDGVSRGTVTGSGGDSIYFGTGGITLTYNGSYIDMDLLTDISPTSIDVIAIP